MRAVKVGLLYLLTSSNEKLHGDNISRRLFLPTLALASLLIAVLAFAAACQTPAASSAEVVSSTFGGVKIQNAPILLVHGFSGYRDLPLMGGYFKEVAEHLQAQGESVFTPALPPYSSTEVRAPFLAQAIDDALSATGSERVHIIAHSQGGIDARYVIQDLNMAHKIASLTTISTPHRGTAVLDVVSMLPRFVSWPLFGSLGWALDTAQDVDTGEVDVDAAFASMNPENMAAFNVAHPVPQDVASFSIAGVTGRDLDACKSGAWGRPSFWDAPDFRIVPTWLFLRGDPGEPLASDGVVPVNSAKWAHFLGCIPADHFDQMGNGAEVFASGDAGVLDHLAFFSAYIARLRAFEHSGDIGAVLAPLAIPRMH